MRTRIIAAVIAIAAIAGLGAAASSGGGNVASSPGIYHYG